MGATLHKSVSPAAPQLQSVIAWKLWIYKFFPFPPRLVVALCCHRIVSWVNKVTTTVYKMCVFLEILQKDTQCIEIFNNKLSTYLNEHVFQWHNLHHGLFTSRYYSRIFKNAIFLSSQTDCGFKSSPALSKAPSWYISSFLLRQKRFNISRHLFAVLLPMHSCHWIQIKMNFVYNMSLIVVSVHFVVHASTFQIFPHL